MLKVEQNEKEKYTTCSGCGRLRLEDELVCENEELWRENPGIRFNGVGPAFRFVRVKSQNVLLCKRCRRLRRISGFVSLIAAGLFGWLRVTLGDVTDSDKVGSGLKASPNQGCWVFR